MVRQTIRTDASIHSAPRYVMKSELRQLIKNVAHLEIDVDMLTDDADLFDAGLSSFHAFQLLLAVEKHFGIEIPDEFLGRKLFRGINALTEIIAQLQHVGHST
ncbi:acyl carrier protein [Burkholderia ubonensis]|uniref:acyl carrier protein n=1 Tax=Burkholderia ubonensis TaxID=101571 RepID=UPI0039F648FC